MSVRTRSRRAPDLAGRLADLPRGRAAAAWAGRESMAGHGVMNLPLSSGHQLGLRVFPQSPSGGYTSIWHRSPHGAWRQYVATGHHGRPRPGLGPDGAGGHLVAALGRLYWITASTARLDGHDLGRPTVLPACPTIGGWPLPRRGVDVVGAAHATAPDTSGPGPMPG